MAGFLLPLVVCMLLTQSSSWPLFGLPQPLAARCLGALRAVSFLSPCSRSVCVCVRVRVSLSLFLPLSLSLHFHSQIFVLNVGFRTKCGSRNVGADGDMCSD